MAKKKKNGRWAFSSILAGYIDRSPPYGMTATTEKTQRQGTIGTKKYRRPKMSREIED